VGEFVDTAGRVRASGIDARFVLVGQPDPGNPSTVSQEQLQEWQREHRVEWWGYHADMPKVFRQAHIVCLPSYYGEGVPMSLLEAASTGHPIVTTDVAGCRDVVKDGDNGFLIPVRDGAALAHALAGAGRRADAERELQRLVELSARQYVSPVQIAIVHAGLGHAQEAIEWLEKGIDGRSAGMVWIKDDPRFDSLRPDSRFQDIVTRLRFP